MSEIKFPTTVSINRTGTLDVMGALNLNPEEVRALALQIRATTEYINPDMPAIDRKITIESSEEGITVLGAYDLVEAQAVELVATLKALADETSLDDVPEEEPGMNIGHGGPVEEERSPSVVTDATGITIIGADSMHPDQALELASNLFMVALRRGGELMDQ